MALKKDMKSQEVYKRLRAEYETMSEAMQALEEKEVEEDVCHIRHTKQKGKPIADKFVRHCRTLLATGSSARSVREQLYLNAGFFLTADKYAVFEAAMPSLRWLQFQREGMGNESYVYSFIRIAKCEEVVQWGFDETSLNGIPTLNQWCRIKEGSDYVVVTIECAGLLVGSTAARVAEHVRVTWERAQSVVALLRTELGEKADDLVPLVNGGVTMAKLRGVMHDTCNTANLVAKQVKVLRDDVGRNMYGAEEWKAMQEDGSGWQDFLCGNHSRNLHFDAFNRRFTQFTKSELGEGMAHCKVTTLPPPSLHHDPKSCPTHKPCHGHPKVRSGGRLRVEPDGESFIRSICKLTHIGPKQYAKGNVRVLSFTSHSHPVNEPFLPPCR